MNRNLLQAFRFFHQEAGYVVGERAVGALRLARAELAASAALCDDDEPALPWVIPIVRYRWEWDEHFDPEGGFSDPRDVAFAREHGAVGCILEHWHIGRRSWEHAASLWGIVESLDNRQRDNYRRVIEAELALESGFGRKP